VIADQYTPDCLLSRPFDKLYSTRYGFAYLGVRKNRIKDHVHDHVHVNVDVDVVVHVLVVGCCVCSRTWVSLECASLLAPCAAAVLPRRARRGIQQCAEPRLFIDLAHPAPEGIALRRAVRLRPREADLIERGQNIGTSPKAPVGVCCFPLVPLRRKDTKKRHESGFYAHTMLRDIEK
jgi:hypothetical protein